MRGAVDQREGNRIRHCGGVRLHAQLNALEGSEISVQTGAPRVVVELGLAGC